MEFTKKDMKILQGVAILFMLALHLFGRKEVNGLYTTFPMINDVPFIYYLALFGDACVPIYLFVSGYGLYINITIENGNIYKKNIVRIFKLLINYWVIFIVFIGVGFFTGKFSEAFAGGWEEFFLNFFLLSNSYNGAWWYVQTYIILVLITPLIIKIVNKYSLSWIILVSGIIYLVSYIQRIKHVIEVGDSQYLNIIVNTIVLVGTSQFSFVVGMLFIKNKIYSRIYSLVYYLKLKNVICLLGILSLITIHSIYESMIIAPLTAIGFICFFSLLKRKLFIENILLYFGKHSTNIWLVHMFFYMSLFSDLIFSPKIPIFIYLLLILCSVFSSYVINILYQPIVKVIDKKAQFINQVSNDFPQKIN